MSSYTSLYPLFYTNIHNCSKDGDQRTSKINAPIRKIELIKIEKEFFKKKVEKDSN